ncbi:MAG: outer rane biosis protein BamB, partial [Phycisphaerales bacterium]|nr:outer rane biosis protein BamB [Phycisphaerales bacterium]
ALNKATGDVVWKSAVPGGDAAGYASVVPVEAAGVRQYVAFLAKGLVGVDRATGAFLWRFDKTGAGPVNMATPVAYGDYIYSGGGLNGAGLIKLTAGGGVGGGAAAGEAKLTPELVYFDQKLPTTSGGTIRVGEYLYGTTAAGLACVEFKTGKVIWQNKSVGPASVCAAEGRLYVRGENGEVALVDATPDGYRERGRFAPAGGPAKSNAKAWAYPVVAGGRLYVRDGPSVWCYDVSGAGSAGRPGGAK